MDVLACGVSWRRLAIEGFDRLVGKGISYGAARSEAPNTHGLDVHVIGAGNSAGQAALFFATHARSVTILCRGDRLEKSMSRYLIDQLESGPTIATRFCWRRACRGSSPAATSASARSSEWPPRSAKAACRSPSSTSTCASWNRPKPLAPAPS
jgi:thioredoxin reductase